MILRKRAEVLSGLRPDKLAYYHKIYLEKRLLTAGDMSYAAGISACRAWFKQKSSVGGNNPFVLSDRTKEVAQPLVIMTPATARM